jgi:DNA-binding protein HU-beta
VNKSQLIDALAGRFEDSKKDAQHALESVLDTITRAVASGEKVAITGFGAFEKIDRPARMVRNPRTGERKRAKKTSVPKFRAGAELKAVVSGAKKLPKLTAAKKATAAKTTATKTAAAKKTTTTAAKKTSTTATAKKTTAKKAPAKRAAATKATATKTAAKKAPAKKTTAKRAPAKRAPRR